MVVSPGMQRSVFDSEEIIVKLFQKPFHNEKLSQNRAAIAIKIKMPHGADLLMSCRDI
jgi:hypothetical protein